MADYTWLEGGVSIWLHSLYFKECESECVFVCLNGFGGRLGETFGFEVSNPEVFYLQVLLCTSVYLQCVLCAIR